MIGKLSAQEIEELLEDNVMGRIGCNDGTKNYVVPVNYVYDGNYVMAHSLEGMKIDMMRKNPQVCFEVDVIKDFTNWKSVIAWGTFEELTGEQERYEVMKLFVDRMLHLKISETATAPELAKARTHPSATNNNPVIYRIRLTEKSGRFEKE
jgi:uncharacterized protein